MQRVFILFLFASLMGKTVQETSGPKPQKPTLVRLSEHLLDGYRKGTRPVHDWRHTTVVQIDIHVYAIMGVDEKNQMLRTYLWVRQSWADEFLTWDPTEYDNVTQISISKLDIWIPDIVVLELTDLLYIPETSYVYVNYKGTVKNNRPYLIATACSLDIYYFPFDTQHCSVSFASWLHTIQDINVTSAEEQDELKHYKSNYMSEGEWNLVSVFSKYKLLRDHDITFAETKYILVIRRKPFFYAMNLIVPSVFLMMIDIAGFYLPPESGERISFKITLLLGYSVFLVIVYDALPATGQPLIGIYYVTCLFFLMLSLLDSIFIVRLVYQHNVSAEVPKWLRHLVLEKLTRLLGVKNKMTEVIHYNNPLCKSLEMETDCADNAAVMPNTACPKENQKPADVASAVTLLSKILKEVVSIREHVDNNNEEMIKKEWLHIAYVLDIFLFRSFVFVMILFAVSLAVIWSLKH